MVTPEQINYALDICRRANPSPWKASRPTDLGALGYFLNTNPVMVMMGSRSDAEYCAASRDPETGWQACLEELERRDTPVQVVAISDGKRKYNGCQKCEQRLSAWMKFCPECGVKLKW